MGIYIKGLTKEDWSNLTIEEIEENFEIVEVKTPYERLLDIKDINELMAKTEPQTDTYLTLKWSCSFSECDNFNHFGLNERCVKCKQMHRKATESQTDCPWEKGADDEQMG